MSRFLAQARKSLKAYVPGEQPQDRSYIKLNTNESPFPPSPGVEAAVAAEAGRLHTGRWRKGGFVGIELDVASVLGLFPGDIGLQAFPGLG